MVQPILDQWMNSFNGLDRFLFKSFGLDFFFSLHNIAINFSFFHAAASLWDSKLHVFRFKREEQCHTLEEFAAIMGHSNKEGLVIPNPLFNCGNLLKTLLSIQKHKLQFFMVNGKL